MFLERHLAIVLRRAAQPGGPVLLQGPSGSGKTTLLQHEFSSHLYINLADTKDRQRARHDPAAFLLRLRRPAIMDNLHRAPELVDYLKLHPIDIPLLLASSIRLSLPINTLELHPPTLAERQRRNPLPLDLIGRFAPAPLAYSPVAFDWPNQSSLPEQNLRSLVPVRDWDRFLLFEEHVRATSGQALHQQNLALQSHVSHRTVVRWLEALANCFLTIQIEASEQSFGRRTLRRPKLHFLAQTNHFESNVVSELYRNACHSALNPKLRYWRDSNGLEIPLLIEHDWDGSSIPVLIAPAPTPNDEATLERWMKLANVKQAAVISQTLPLFPRKNTQVLRYASGQL